MKLQKEFRDFAKEITIGNESVDLIEKRETLQTDIKDRLPSELDKHNIELKKSDIRIFDQGSYKYNTTILGPTIDRDVAIEIPLDINENSDPRKIKKYLESAINYVNLRTVTIKEPCVNVAYLKKDEEWMHIDLPLYAIHNGSDYLARGKKNSDDYSWEIADPNGLNNYLCGMINGNDQLRRIIRYIKKWRDIKYANSTLDHEIPPSIGLTIMACDYFKPNTTDEGDDDLTTLYLTMLAIKREFSIVEEGQNEITSADISCYLPVLPHSDIFKKMKDSSNTYAINFYKKLCEAIDNLYDAILVENDHDAAKFVQKVLGNEFQVPPKPASSSSTHIFREHSFG